MTRRDDRLRFRIAAAASATLVVTALLMLSGQSGALARVRVSSHTPTTARATAECEGDACAQVALTFDESKQEYRATNNSTDRWARITASNMAASASACLAPGKDAYLPLKSIAGSYHAAYAEARCGEDAAAGPPGD